MLKPFVLAGLTALLMTACGQQTTTETSAAPTAHAASQTSAADNAANTGETAVTGSLLERINNKGTITVGTEGTYAPFTYHDAAGKLTGYDVEVSRAVAEKLGITVEFKETQWDAMLAGLKAGRFDLVANQVSLTTPERQATFDKTAEYSWSGPMMLVRQDENGINSLADIKGRKAAQTLSSNYGEMAVAAEAKIVPVDGMAQALTLVQQKRADLTLNDSLAFLDYLKKNPDSGLKTAWTAGAEEKRGAGFVANKGNDEALAKISAAVEELRQDGTLKKLGEEFFGQDVSVK
ncbi:MAG: amino acid ABC transporter substrate-binding protein [Neisseria sp.]|nr:amino acid ABC transporter substrate-binding protein [Neisseria sp.]